MTTSLRALRHCAILLATCVIIPSAARAQAAPAADSTAPAPPPWQNKVRYGGGLSVGPPLLDARDSTSATRWCLEPPTHRAPGDYGHAGATWRDATLTSLFRVLTDSTEHGVLWRRIVGDAPRLAQGESITAERDEATCRAIADVVHREVLGWRDGPTPVVVLRARDFLLVFPALAARGEWGLAVGMNADHTVKGVVTW